MACSMLMLLAVVVDVGVVLALMLLADASVDDSCFVTVACVVDAADIAAARTFRPGGES